MVRNIRHCRDISVPAVLLQLPWVDCWSQGKKDTTTKCLSSAGKYPINSLQNQAIAEALYNSSWFTMSISNRKMILFMLQRARTVPTLSVGHLAPLNLETGMDIYKTLYSYFLLLKDAFNWTTKVAIENCSCKIVNYLWKSLTSAIKVTWFMFAFNFSIYPFRSTGNPHCCSLQLLQETLCNLWYYVGNLCCIICKFKWSQSFQSAPLFILGFRKLEEE